MGENALGQSDCRIHKSAIAQEQLGQSVAIFLKQVYLKNDEFIQPDILYVDRDSGKFNCHLENLDKLWS